MRESGPFIIVSNLPVSGQAVESEKPLARTLRPGLCPSQHLTSNASPGKVRSYCELVNIARVRRPLSPKRRITPLENKRPCRRIVNERNIDLPVRDLSEKGLTGESSRLPNARNLTLLKPSGCLIENSEHNVNIMKTRLSDFQVGGSHGYLPGFFPAASWIFLLFPVFSMPIPRKRPRNSLDRYSRVLIWAGAFFTLTSAISSQSRKRSIVHSMPRSKRLVQIAFNLREPSPRGFKSSRLSLHRPVFP